MLFPHPHSSSPCRLPQATGAQKPLMLLQLSCMSALWSFPSLLPCHDSWLLFCSSLYGNFAFLHISCTGKAKAEKCLFIFSAASPLPRDGSHPTVPHNTPPCRNSSLRSPHPTPCPATWAIMDAAKIHQQVPLPHAVNHDHSHVPHNGTHTRQCTPAT